VGHLKNYMALTPYHAKYFAHELTRRYSSDSLQKLAASLSDAQVDLNPHQVEAALFAFRSPLSKGAILADEVGLGKTIEAGIVISQKCAELACGITDNGLELDIEQCQRLFSLSATVAPVIPACRESFLKEDAGQAGMTNMDWIPDQVRNDIEKIALKQQPEILQITAERD